MFNNKCFCEKCNKIENIKIIQKYEVKEFNIGKIKYKKLYGICNVCNSEVYSISLNDLNKKEILNKLKELESEKILIKIFNKKIIDTNDKDLIKKLINKNNKNNR